MRSTMRSVTRSDIRTAMITPVRMIVVATAAILSVACQKDDAPIKTTSTGEANVSASGDSAAARGHSMVRIVNAVAGGGDASVRLNDTTLFADVKVASVTDFREIASNLAKFSATAAANSGMSFAQNDETLMDGDRYTIFLVAEDVSHSTLRIVKDEVIADSGKARIRVVHAAPGAPELDISMAGSKDKLFSGVNFKSEAGYKDVDPTATTIEVRAKDEPKVLLRIAGVNLKRGTATTIVISGSSKLSAFKFTDTEMAPASKQ